MIQILKDFKSKTFKELNDNMAFKTMILNICEHRAENYRYWKPSKHGFILITNESFLEFDWNNKDYFCITESNVYS